MKIPETNIMIPRDLLHIPQSLDARKIQNSQVSKVQLVYDIAMGYKVSNLKGMVISIRIIMLFW